MWDGWRPRRRRSVAAARRWKRRTLLSATDPFINEFLTNNKAGLVAADGSHPDWIEIYNPGPAERRFGRLEVHRQGRQRRDDELRHATGAGRAADDHDRRRRALPGHLLR